MVAAITLEDKPFVRTEVCITIDTEFSIAGAFNDPKNRTPVGEAQVVCRIDGEEHGLGFLLETFKRHGTAATFFVEALNTAYFGDGPMGAVVERILAAGQDAQLHLHPCWAFFRHGDWVERLARERPSDRCDGRSVDELDELIGLGLDSFERWGAPRPVALRTGNLQADRAVYQAMERHGLKLASNLGVAYQPPSDPTLDLSGGRHWIGGVLEVPILSYTQLAFGGRRWRRLLAITASSWREIESLLWQARAAGISPVVVITHPFEFIKGGRADGDKRQPNRINKTRLERLCQFLAAHPEDFASASFGDAGAAWLAAAPLDQPDLTAPLLPVLGRMVQNKANDLIPAL